MDWSPELLEILSNPGNIKKAIANRDRAIWPLLLNGRLKAEIGRLPAGNLMHQLLAYALHEYEVQRGLALGHTGAAHHLQQTQKQTYGPVPRDPKAVQESPTFHRTWDPPGKPPSQAQKIPPTNFPLKEPWRGSEYLDEVIPFDTSKGVPEGTQKEWFGKKYPTRNYRGKKLHEVDPQDLMRLLVTWEGDRDRIRALYPKFSRALDEIYGTKGKPGKDWFWNDPEVQDYLGDPNFGRLSPMDQLRYGWKGRRRAGGNPRKKDTSNLGGFAVSDTFPQEGQKTSYAERVRRGWYRKIPQDFEPGDFESRQRARVQEVLGAMWGPPAWYGIGPVGAEVTRFMRSLEEKGLSFKERQEAMEDLLHSDYGKVKTLEDKVLRLERLIEAQRQFAIHRGTEEFPILDPKGIEVVRDPVLYRRLREGEGPSDAPELLFGLAPGEEFPEETREQRIERGVLRKAFRRKPMEEGEEFSADWQARFQMRFGVRVMTATSLEELIAVKRDIEEAGHKWEEVIRSFPDFHEEFMDRRNAIMWKGKRDS